MPEGFTVASRFRDYSVDFVSHPHELEAVFGDPRSFLIADPKVLAVLGDDVRPTIDAHRLYELTPSEDRKTLDEAASLVSWLVSAQARRGCRLVALGGGVVQDVTAFTASMLYRGVDWMFVPTTLLAQADSCIGGKTSINVGGHKNIVGNFNPPTQVLIYPGFLQSLPEPEIKSGIGEMMHFFIYADSSLTQDFVREYDALLASPDRLESYVAESLRIKKSVIEIDEFDQGERNKFNYGHTFGHALESVSGFGVRHGQAVTVGMDLANFLSVRIGILGEEEDQRLHRQLRGNFPGWDFSVIDLDEYIGALAKDKKNIDQDLTCILCEGAGHLVKQKIPMDHGFRRAIGDYFEHGMRRA